MSNLLMKLNNLLEKGLQPASVCYNYPEVNEMGTLVQKQNGSNLETIFFLGEDEPMSIAEMFDFIENASANGLKEISTPVEAEADELVAQFLASLDDS